MFVNVLGVFMLGLCAAGLPAEAQSVVINEFLASNQSRSPLEPGELLDGYGDASDWIELYNNSDVPVDISGWYLTDDATDTTQWQFPAGSGELILQPGDYRVVFASGKTQAENADNYPHVDPAGYLHTNFSLSRDGEYLGLFDADGTTPIHEYNHIALGGGVYGYPTQRKGISYGYYNGQARYFSPPTPGAENVADVYEGFVEKPYADIKGGVYVYPVEVVLTCAPPDADAQIRYTTDGSAPSVINGVDYTGPITIDKSTTLVVKAFKPDLHPSYTLIEKYIFVQRNVASFNSNLPIIVIDTLGEEIPRDRVNRPFVACRAVILDTDEATGRAAIIGLDHLEEKGVGDIRRRGQSTYAYGHFALEFRDEHGRDKYVAPLGLPPDSDFVLSYDVYDWTLLKNEIAFKWFRDMGHYAPRQRYVEVFLNEDGGRIRSDHYVGLMVLREDINRDKNRVDIARLDAAHDQEPRISGGYIVKHDKYDENDTDIRDYLENDGYGIALGGTQVAPVLQYPPSRQGRVTQAHIDWITDYMNEVMAVLWQNTSSAYYPGPEAVYTDYIDVTSWIDHFIVEQVANDQDAFWASHRTHKEREGKMYSGPPWDFDRAFHNNREFDFNRSYDVWRVQNRLFGRWHQKLQAYLEYQIELADRWYEHRKEVINTDQTLAYIDDMVELMSEAMARPQEKDYSGSRDWATNVDLLKAWIINRLDWMDGQIASRFAARPPIFTPAGSEVNLGDVLYISKPSGAPGTIYYTVDGTDPRLPGGGINPNTQVYGDTATDSLVVISSVWKYLYDGSDQGTAWRAYDFDDSSWGSGPGRLGFGQDGIVTNIGPRVHGQRSAYFRHKFTVSNVSAITALGMTVVHDDGAVVYLNGQEIGRIYMPDGEIHYDTQATTTVYSTPDTTVLSGISPAFLVEGENTLAVSVHQISDGSSDIVFDLEFEASRSVEPSQIVFYKNTCVKARIKDGSNWSALNQAEFVVPMTLLHYWHFNNLPSGTLTDVSADYSVNPGVWITYPGSGAGYMDRVNDGTTLNARMLEPAGYGLRVRNPSDTRELLLNLPTTGYQNILLSYAATRTSNGATQQSVYYRLSNTAPWVLWTDAIEITEDYQVVTVDFSEVPGIDDNPEFAVRILFGGPNASGSSGNNRFDNITLEGLPLAGTNLAIPVIRDPSHEPRGTSLGPQRH